MSIPTILKHPQGGYFLYFKPEKARMGLAVAENLDVPYVQLPFPVTANDQTIEKRVCDFDQEKAAVHCGPEDAANSKFERPQLSVVDGQIKYLHVFSGHHIFGGEYTASYVLQFKK